MKYIKRFESFKQTSVNEEFLGSLFKGLKNKLSLGFSKMFGSASAVQKLMEEYKKEVFSAQAKKKESLKALGDYFKSVKDGGEKDSDKIKELKKNIDLTDKNFTEQVKLIKEKFDIKFNDVIKDEKNPKIKSFIQLQKIEMQQEILQNEMNSILSDGSLKPEDINDPDFKAIIEELKKKGEDSKKLAEDEKKKLEASEEKVLGFDIVKAKQAADSGKVYLWEESPMKDHIFPKDDTITFFSNTNKEETIATVIEESPSENERIKVKTDKGNEIEINKKTIISSDSFKKKTSE
jgi:hypothetical protein